MISSFFSKPGRQYGVSYFNPQVPNWNTKLIPIEHEAKENCAVLLFVIGTETLGVASLVEVSHYIGRRRQVVLCLSRFTEPDNTRVADINVRFCVVIRHAQPH